MTAMKHLVTIKGVKDGLVFVLDDACTFADLLAELTHKLENTHQKILTGPIIHVHLKFGKRAISEEQEQEVRGLISRRGNLVIQSIKAAEPIRSGSNMDLSGITVKRGIVRSGQTIQHQGNLLFLGDVNPGGTIIASGDIFVMGSLRGMAHAGSEGNDKAIISAAHLKPTQLRIATIVSRPPDEWGVDEAYMEFAYILEDKMEIDKIHHLHRIRPDHPA